MSLRDFLNDILLLARIYINSTSSETQCEGDRQNYEYGHRDYTASLSDTSSTALESNIDLIAFYRRHLALQERFCLGAIPL